MDQQYIDSFWAHVAKGDGCWEWAASVGSHGYGNAWDGRTVRTAHRLSWELHHGPIPAGMSVLHTCDNRRCVRPDHLWLGTPADNIHDMDAKGRRVSVAARGERQGSAKLTARKVLAIRAQYAAGVPSRHIAAEFGINKAYVWHLAKGHSWAHLPVATQSPDSTA